MGAGSVQKTIAGAPVHNRRRTLPQMAPIAVGCGVLAMIVRLAAPGVEQRVGVYLSGIITAIMFVSVGLYSVRKRNLWFSLRLLYLARRILPKPLFETAVLLDRLESWRAAHVVIAMLSLLPLWWHMQSHLMGPLEAALASAVALLFASGLFGVIIQDRLPNYMTRFAEHEVRTQDVNAKINAVYVEAEEKILGHTEEFTRNYLARIKPVLLEDRSSWVLLAATLSRRDIGKRTSEALNAGAPTEGNDAIAWKQLADLAMRKVNLEQNDFNLWLSNSWLRFHVVVALLTFSLLAFHILAVLYFAGR